jgi:hypothetical protein
VSLSHLYLFQACLHTSLFGSFSILCRVTRLGKFSPIGQLLIVGSHIKIIEVAQNLGVLFPRKKLCYYVHWRNLVFGNILGDFSTNSSDHPDPSATFLVLVHEGVVCCRQSQLERGRKMFAEKRDSVQALASLKNWLLKSLYLSLRHRSWSDGIRRKFIFFTLSSGKRKN